MRGCRRCTLAPEALVLSRVNAFYGDSHVLHDVSFRLREGHVLALLGRNGAGKTTCIHSISGLLRPRSGSIELFGERIEGRAPEAIARRGIGLVPQGRRVVSSLTVRENLTVAARGGGAPGPQALLPAVPPPRGGRGPAPGAPSPGRQQTLATRR